MSDTLLEVDGLSVSFASSGYWFAAVNDISFSVNTKEIVTIVGESGSGKSATAMALARLNEGEGTKLSGHVRLSGCDIMAKDKAALRKLRGQGIAMIFQDSAAALNPCETIGHQISESLVVHGRYRWRLARHRAVELLAEVGLPEPQRRANCYPHQLSGGQRQRAMVALALACDPKLLIADEPTTAIDVTIQAQILALLKRLVDERGMSLLLITHDLGVVAAIADRVLVIYAGQLIETGTAEELLSSPAHPYTRDLINSGMPDALGNLKAIPGSPPALEERAVGCVYSARCSRAVEQCRSSQPKIAATSTGSVACFFPISEVASP